MSDAGSVSDQTDREALGFPPIHLAQIDARLAGHEWSDIKSHEADLRVTHELMGTDFNTAAGYQSFDHFRDVMGTAQRGLMTGETQVADARQPNPWAQRSMLEGGVVGGGGGMGGPRAARSSGYKLSEGPPKIAESGANRYHIEDHEGPAGFADFTLANGGKHAVVENVAVEGRANAMGPRAIRDLGQQFFERNPEVETIGGLRVSGARVQTGQGSGEMTLHRSMFFPGE